MEGNWISLNQISDYGPDEARSAQLGLATRGNAAPECITDPASQVKTALLDRWCNAGLLKCAVIRACFSPGGHVPSAACMSLTKKQREGWPQCTEVPFVQSRYLNCSPHC